jgi:hypothetical protein
MTESFEGHADFEKHDRRIVKRTSSIRYQKVKRRRDMFAGNKMSKKLMVRKLQLLHILSEGIAATVLVGAILLSFSSPVLAQQRIVVEKATGNVVDVGDGTLQYDSRFFDHLDLANSPIPVGADIRKYTLNAAGAIVLRPKDELVKGFSDEWRNDLIARINGIGLSADLKALLIEIVKGMRR